MPSGAKKLSPPAPSTVLQIVDKTPPAIAELQASMREHQRAACDEFGDGLPWHPDHYESEIRGELRRGCEAFLRAGRLLLVARACAMHGEWEGMLGRLGVEPRQAQRMMEAARRVAKLPKASPATHLIAAAGGQAKLIELLSLPEDQFAELATDGETNGLSVDDVEQMTRNELRAAIRNARADTDAKDQVLKRTTEQLQREQETTAKLRRERAKATPSDDATKLRKLLSDMAFQIEVMVSADGDANSLLTRARELQEHCQAQGDTADVWIAGVFAQVQRRIHMVRESLFIEHVACGDPALEARLAIGEAG